MNRAAPSPALPLKGQGVVRFGFFVLTILFFTPSLFAQSILISPSPLPVGQVLNIAIKPDIAPLSMTGRLAQEEFEFTQGADGVWYAQVTGKVPGYYRLEIVENKQDLGRMTRSFYLMCVESNATPEIDQQVLALQPLIEEANTALTRVEPDHHRLVLENADLAKLVQLLRVKIQILYSYNALLVESIPKVDLSSLEGKRNSWRAASEAGSEMSVDVSETASRLKEEKSILAAQIALWASTPTASEEMGSMQPLMIENLRLRQEQLGLTLMALDLENFRQDFTKYYPNGEFVQMSVGEASIHVLQRELFSQNQAIELARIQLVGHTLTHTLASIQVAREKSVAELSLLQTREAKLREVLQSLTESLKKKVQDPRPS